MNKQLAAILIVAVCLLPSPADAKGGGSGDVDCNAVVDSRDALLVLQASADIEVDNALPCAKEGDVDDDAIFTAADASIILRMHAGFGVDDVF